ncbi:MAG: hypothetical protein GF421_13705 [Candidatus Aminicenantes bacterium]|nr:hypothetical protein [Candidatus Aminicenantes bacterium]
MVHILNSVLSKFFEIIFLPFQNISPWFGMIFISLLTGLIMLFIFKLTSDQEGIKKTKNKIKAHLLELRLYKDDLRTSFKAQGHILLSNFKYMKYSLKPLLIMIIPVILILIHSNFWFAYDSLGIEETALLKVKLSDDFVPTELDTEITANDSIQIETAPLRINEQNEIDWRFSAQKAGVHEIKIKIGEQLITKSVSVSQNPLSQISPFKKRKNIMDQLLYPLEKPLEKNSFVKSVEITYPSSGFHVLGINFHWIVVFFILSIVFGFSFKGFFGVEI